MLNNDEDCVNLAGLYVIVVAALQLGILLFIRVMYIKITYVHIYSVYVDSYRFDLLCVYIVQVQGRHE